MSEEKKAVEVVEEKFDPRLRQALNEIKQIIINADIAGQVILVSKTHGEYAMMIDHMTWSVAKQTKDGMNLNLAMKSNAADTTSTLHVIYCIRDLCEMFFYKFKEMAKHIETKVKVDHEHVSGRVHRDDYHE